jgi:hypothetical protein
MHEELPLDLPVSRWTKLKELPQRILRDRPQLLMGLGIGAALLGFLLPLLFPVVAAVLLVKIAGALQSGGVAALAGQWLNLGVLAVCATLTGSLWRLRADDPAGEPLTEQQAPELFKLVDELRAAFQARPVTDIHLSDEPCLKVHRVPRTGYPFLYRHVLVVGLPVLQCLSLDQFKCLLASHLGELSVVRADVAGWIGQVVRAWEGYRTAVAGRWHPAALLYRGLLAWYAPLLTALARRLDGGHRLRRDHYALEVASDDLVVEMLAGEVIMQRFLQEHYWPTVYRTAEHSATPNFKVFRNLEAVFRRRTDSDTVALWIREAFVGKWRSDDRDPGLKTRLHEIGHGDIAYRHPEGRSAAQVLLGASYQWVIDRCDARWAEEHQEDWRVRHEKSRRQYEKLAALRDAMQKHGLHGEEAMTYAALVKRYGTPEEAREAYEAVLRLNPGDARINFGTGKFLLSCGDGRGVKILERAMALDKRFVDPACRLISGFVVQHRRQAASSGHAAGAGSA